MDQSLTYQQRSIISIGIYDMLALSKSMDVEIYPLVLKVLQQKMENQDCYQFLCSNEFQVHFNQCNKKNSLENDINKLSHLIKILIEHDFNKTNFSSLDYEETRKLLVQKIAKDFKIIEFLKFILRLSAIDQIFIQSSSNSINLLVQMRINLSQQCWQKIKIKNTIIAGGNFYKSNLSDSEFDNVQIDGINLNKGILFNCKQKNIILNELHEWKGHNSSINSVCFSHDGQTIASASDDGCIIFWDFKTGKQKLKKKIEKKINSLHFSPDNATLVSGDQNGKIYLWNYRQGKIKSQFQAHYCVNSVCFSPDGAKLASGGEGCFFCDGLNCCDEFNGFDGFDVAHICFEDHIGLWDVRTGKLKSKLNGHHVSVKSVCFSPDGAILASGSDDKTICLWDVSTGELKSQLKGHDGSVKSVCFSPDGVILASGSIDETIRLWDVSTGKVKLYLWGDNGMAHTVCNSVCFSLDGMTLVSGNEDGAILWDMRTHDYKQYLTRKHNVNSVCLSPDGTTWTFGSSDATIGLLPAITGELEYQQNGYSKNFTSVCFSPDGATLASADYGSTICLWDVSTGELKSQLKGHDGSVKSVCFSPDGATLASGSYDSTICLWDVSTGKFKQQLKHGKDWNRVTITSVCFSPDGATLAFGIFNQIISKQDETIGLWDVSTWKLKSFFNGHTGQVFSVCFSPDGATLAFGSYDATIGLWHVSAGELKSQLNGHTGCVNSLQFSPDGATLASGSSDKTIHLWDVNTGELKSQLNGHTGCVNSLHFSPDGATLASGSGDKTIRLWDSSTGELKSQINGHNGSVNSVCFSPDGATLASGSSDKTIRLWDLSTGELNSQFKDQNGQDTSFSITQDGQFCLLNRMNASQIMAIQDYFLPKQQFMLSSHPFQVPPYVTKVLISESYSLQANGTLIFKGYIFNHQGRNLKPILLHKQSIFLDQFFK